MSPLEKRIGGWGEANALVRKKVSTRTMIKKAVPGGKIGFHLRGKEKTFIDLPTPQNSTQPLYFPNGYSLITLHVTESGI